MVFACACLAALFAGSAGAERHTHVFAPLRSETRATGPTVTSTNWAGYAVSDPAGSTTPTTFTSVTGTWKQPRAACAKGTTAFSATWVGLGGFSDGSQALEQIGTSADCSRKGKAIYSAWYELVPGPAVRINLKVAAADMITTSVNVNGSTVLVQVKNRTRHTVFSREVTAANLDLSSAEWVEEAPATCTSFGNCRVLPLANFGRVSMTRGATIGSAHPGTISDPAWQATSIRLVPDVSAPSPAGATPSDLTADGRGFDVVWQPSATG